MLKLIMHPNGELFLQTPDSEHPLHRTLSVTISKDIPREESPTPATMIALKEALSDEIVKAFGIRLEQLLAPIESTRDICPNYNYLTHLMFREVMMKVEGMVEESITETLTPYNVTSFEVYDN